MEVIKFVFEGMTPSLNDEIAGAKKHWSEYSREKKAQTSRIHVLACSQYRGPVVEKPFFMVCLWFLKDGRTDPDNRYFGIKYLLDGLQAAGVIENDNFKNTAGGLLHLPFIDKSNPRIEVYLFPSATALDILPSLSTVINGL